jgi:Mature-T-Cell Proliferation I type
MLDTKPAWPACREGVYTHRGRPHFRAGCILLLTREPNNARKALRGQGSRIDQTFWSQYSTHVAASHSTKMEGTRARRRDANGNDHQDPAERKCKPYACDIQSCLRHKGFQQSKCVAEILRWERCVAEVRAEIAAVEAAQTEVASAANASS